MGREKKAVMCCSAILDCVFLCVKMGVCVNTCVRAYMTLEVEGVVEAFAAEAAEVSLCVTVTFDMSVQHSLV